MFRFVGEIFAALASLFVESGRSLAERQLSYVIWKAFRKGLAGPAIREAFEMAYKENKRRKLGLTNNLVLNLVREIAHEATEDIQYQWMCSQTNTTVDVDREVASLRALLPEKEWAR